MRAACNTKYKLSNFPLIKLKLIGLYYAHQKMILLISCLRILTHAAIKVEIKKNAESLNLL